MRIVVWLLPFCLSLGAACASQPPAPALPPFDTSIGVKDLMANLMDPTADALWESVGTIVTKEGTFERAPATDDEWNRVKASAITLVETGNLLLIPARSGGNPDWIAKTQAMITQSKRAIKAAEDHDRQATFDIGADIYETCVSCHKQFDPAIRDAK
jgi:mono/diheme cytochrome c family protein